MLLVTTCAGVAAALLFSALAAVIGGASEAASAAAGGSAVLAFSAASLALIDWAERHAPHLAIPLFMLGFGVKVAGLAVALPLVRPGSWLEPAWTIAAGLIVLLVWQTAEILSFTKMRISVDPQP